MASKVSGRSTRFHPVFMCRVCVLCVVSQKRKEEEAKARAKVAEESAKV